MSPDMHLWERKSHPPLATSNPYSATVAYGFIGVDYGVKKLAMAALPLEWGGAAPVAFSHFWSSQVTADDVLQMAPLVLNGWLKEIGASNEWMFIEYPFLAHNRKTAMRMAMMAGALFAAASPIVSYVDFVEPSTWKKHVVGRGNANKEDTMNYLTANHPDLTFLNDDEADSWCMALYAEMLSQDEAA